MPYRVSGGTQLAYIEIERVSSPIGIVVYSESVVLWEPPSGETISEADKASHTRQCEGFASRLFGDGLAVAKRSAATAQRSCGFNFHER